jgi:pyruvate carboxylase subunit B
VGVDGTEYRVDSIDLDGVRSLVIDGEQHEVAVRHSAGRGSASTTYVVDGTEVEVVDPLTHQALESRGGAGGAGRDQVTAYMPGRVVTVLVEEGQEVEAGQGVVVLEAMKMENEITAERAGTLKKLHVVQGQAVEGGDPLFEIG